MQMLEQGRQSAFDCRAQQTDATTTASVVGAATIVSKTPDQTITFVAGYMGSITTNDSNSTTFDKLDLDLLHDLQTLEEEEKERILPLLTRVTSIFFMIYKR